MITLNEAARLLREETGLNYEQFAQLLNPHRGGATPEYSAGTIKYLELPALGGRQVLAYPFQPNDFAIYERATGVDLYLWHWAIKTRDEYRKDAPEKQKTLAFQVLAQCQAIIAENFQHPLGGRIPA